MQYLVPSKEFDDIPLTKTADKAYLVVKGLTENQVRHALWNCLVVLFGDQRSNAPDILYSLGMPTNISLAEAHVLLMQIGAAESHPIELKALENFLEAAKHRAKTKERN